PETGSRNEALGSAIKSVVPLPCTACGVLTGSFTNTGTDVHNLPERATAASTIHETPKNE
ncbi:MAG: hypothetical protein ACRET0_14145, partial [Steroidobacteraceae bacterium]